MLSIKETMPLLIEISSWRHSPSYSGNSETFSMYGAEHGSLDYQF